MPLTKIRYIPLGRVKPLLSESDRFPRKGRGPRGGIVMDRNPFSSALKLCVPGVLEGILVVCIKDEWKGGE